MQEQAIKEKVKERYGKIALTTRVAAHLQNSAVALKPSLFKLQKNIGYDAKDLEAVPESSILRVGCGAPVNFADIKEGEVVVDIASRGGIDVFLPAIKVRLWKNDWY
jgi:arsenite methyltransferase